MITRMFKIGDAVILDKNLILKWSELPNWYTEDVFKVIGYDPEEDDIVILDKKLPNVSREDEPNKILQDFLKISIKEQRKEKLLKIK